MGRSKEWVKPTKEAFDAMDGVERRREVRNLIRAVGHEVGADDDTIGDAMGIGEGYLEVCFEGPVGDLDLAEKRLREDYARAGYTA